MLMLKIKFLTYLLIYQFNSKVNNISVISGVSQISFVKLFYVVVVIVAVHSEKAPDADRDTDPQHWL